MVRLKADRNVGGVSFGGQEYPLVKGCIEVPEEAACELLGFGWGFTLASQQPDQEGGNGEPAAEDEAAPEGKSKR